MTRQRRRLLINKRGLTLIEILAALTISTFVIGLAFSVLLSSIHSYKKTEGKQLLQQEANLILTQLRTIHRTQSSYVITYDSTANLYKVTLSDGATQSLGSPKYKLEIILDDILITDTVEQQIDATRKEYHILLNISDPATNNLFSIETGLTRL
ncbi:PulJ/GspJ family protein [Calidifontibacillus oryziterrae]|uniref:PulJ/GspJ family protein n=1 Tax=Calidifontibacillus oryziterrae TaxID=1191699 RepID=UPI000381019B|nr:prepilin-type N-terminal cleavage/methylation domain-containing protein [Calidifontibacillus oryziterrae]